MGKPCPTIPHLDTSILLVHIPYQSPPICTQNLYTVIQNRIDNFVHGLTLFAVSSSAFCPAILSYLGSYFSCLPDNPSSGCISSKVTFRFPRDSLVPESVHLSVKQPARVQLTSYVTLNKSLNPVCFEVLISKIGVAKKVVTS